MRVTIAFFQAFFLMMIFRHRLARLAGMFMTRTLTTSTLGQMVSTASLIWCLLARGSTSKTYWNSSYANAVDFSVITGRRMTSRQCISIPPPRSQEPRCPTNP
jgi:hypothetical protein